MASSKNIKARLASASAFLDQLASVLDERSRLVRLLNLTPSQADNLDLINLLSSIHSSLDYLHQDIQAAHLESFAPQFNAAVDTYSSYLLSLAEDPYIDTHEYLYTSKIVPAKDEPKKSVRFKDYDDSDPQHSEDTMRAQLMGTSATFKPYKDDPVGDGNENGDSSSSAADTQSLLSVDTSNQELFAQNQQQLLAQDRNLDVLFDSVLAQRSMGHSINSELGDHVILLNDLEQGVDSSTSRLGRATSSLQSYRRKVQENGSLVTIIVLTVILVLLLVVLN